MGLCNSLLSSEYYPFSLAHDAWTKSGITRYALHYKPKIVVREMSFNSTIPPVRDEHVDCLKCVDVSVEYDVDYQLPNVPVELYPHLVAEFRRNIESAIDYEEQAGGLIQFKLDISLVDALESKDDTKYFGLSAYILNYARMFLKLLTHSSDAARNEFNEWVSGNSVIFNRLRIWAAGLPGFMNSGEVAKIILCMPRKCFWDSYQQSDLMKLMQTKWSEFKKTEKNSIEKRIISGREKYKNETDEEFVDKNARIVLCRLEWLKQNGCSLTKPYTRLLQKLKRIVKDWVPKDASAAVCTYGIQTGWTKYDTEYKMLIGLGSIELLREAEKLKNERTTGFIEKNPFRGLVEKQPDIAINALKDALMEGLVFIWAWGDFLYSESRASDDPRMIQFISDAILQAERRYLISVLDPIVGWMDKHRKKIDSVSNDLFPALYSKVLDTHEEFIHTIIPDDDNSYGNAINTSLNSLTGSVTRLLINDLPSHSDQEGLSKWFTTAERLLHCNGRNKENVLAILCTRMDWMYQVNRQWCESNVLPLFSFGDSALSDAIIYGYLWGFHNPSIELYKLLKKQIMDYAINNRLDSQYREVIVDVLLAGWLYIKGTRRLVSDIEFRTILINANEEFRLDVLRKLKNRLDTSRESGYSGENVLKFLKNVWPRQVFIQTAPVSNELCGIAFRSDNLFDRFARSIIPLLTICDTTRLSIRHILYDLKNDDFPYSRNLLRIFDKVLPPNTALWPLGMSRVLDLMVEHIPDLKRDEKYIRLIRMMGVHRP